LGEFTALVLAGRRGASDELADALAASDASGHHTLLDVGGVPMLLRVVRTLKASPSVGRIVVSIDEPAVLDDVPELRASLADGSLACRAALDSPSRSVLDALADADAGEKVLVVTADHALLTTEMVEHFAAQAAGDADVLVAVVTATVIRARYPESTRTYIKLRDDWVSGANLFAFLTPEAKRAAVFWGRAERFRKRPWRLVAAIGPVALLLFLLRRLDLEAALERVSNAMGVRARAIRMPWAEAAIDVDRPSDLELVNQILKERERGG
jgi:GTP:adenosylcobinamide-phosphate guanylyltransferase